MENMKTSGGEFDIIGVGYRNRGMNTQTQTKEADVVTQVESIVSSINQHGSDFDTYISQLGQNKKLDKEKIEESYSKIINTIDTISAESCINMMCQMGVIDIDDIYENKEQSGGAIGDSESLLQRLRDKIKSCITPPHVLPTIMTVPLRKGDIKKITFLKNNDLKSTELYMHAHTFSSEIDDDYSFYMRKHPFANIVVDVDDSNKISLSLKIIVNGQIITKELDNGYAFDFNMILTKEEPKIAYVINKIDCSTIKERLKKILDNEKFNSLTQRYYKEYLQEIITYVPELLIFDEININKLVIKSKKYFNNIKLYNHIKQFDRGTCWVCTTLNTILLQHFNNVDVKINEDIEKHFEVIKQTLNVNIFAKYIFKKYKPLLDTTLDTGGFAHLLYNYMTKKTIPLFLKFDKSTEEFGMSLSQGIYYLQKRDHITTLYILDKSKYYMIDSANCKLLVNQEIVPKDDDTAILTIMDMTSQPTDGIPEMTMDHSDDIFNKESNFTSNLKEQYNILHNQTHDITFTFNMYNVFQQHVQIANNIINEKLGEAIDTSNIKSFVKGIQDGVLLAMVQDGELSNDEFLTVIKSNAFLTDAQKIAFLAKMQEKGITFENKGAEIGIEVTKGIDKINFVVEYDKDLIDVEKTFKFDIINNYMKESFFSCLYYYTKYVRDLKHLDEQLEKRQHGGRKQKYKLYKKDGSYYVIYKGHKIMITYLGTLAKIKKII
jgi:hypothetical protein